MESREKFSTSYLEFEYNSLLIDLFGSQESNLKFLEKELSVIISTPGNQVDLPKGTRSELQDAMTILAGVKGVGYINFREKDVVRHPPSYHAL